MQIDMKLFFKLILLIFVCLGSCKSKEPVPKVIADFSALDAVSKDSPTLSEKPKQFECGTANLKYFSNIVDEWADQHPNRLKKIAFVTSKKKAMQFFDLLNDHSFKLSLFDKKVIRDFYLPKKTDSIWFVGPIDQFCFIKQYDSDSIPVKISSSINDDQKFVLELSTDLSITEIMSDIVTQNHLGKIQHR
jgi:hypothetical protein